MSKYRVGEQVHFIYSAGGIISGKILRVKVRRMLQTKYLVGFGVGAMGVRTSISSEWVKESFIFPGHMSMAPEENPHE